VVLLTHAHLDHCGRLPLLAKRGFRGRATRELARLVVLDAAHLQEEDAEHHARVGRQGADQASAQPLYTVADARNCLDKFKRTAGYDQPLELFPGVGATFVDAGHILGSASIVLDRAEAGRQLKLIFSGDLGNAGRPLLRGPATPPKADVAVIETTYGDRLHKPLGPSIEEFYGAITDTFRRGGNVVIPTFALERAQELLSVLHHGIETGRLANTIQVFLDSPMAISATEVFKRFPESLDDQTAKLIAAGGDPLALPGLHLTRRRLRYRLRSLSGTMIAPGQSHATRVAECPNLSSLPSRTTSGRRKLPAACGRDSQTFLRASRRCLGSTINDGQATTSISA